MQTKLQQHRLILITVWYGFESEVRKISSQRIQFTDKNNQNKKLKVDSLLTHPPVDLNVHTVGDHKVERGPDIKATFYLCQVQVPASYPITCPHSKYMANTILRNIIYLFKIYSNISEAPPDILGDKVWLSESQNSCQNYLCCPKIFTLTGAVNKP